MKVTDSQRGDTLTAADTESCGLFGLSTCTKNRLWHFDRTANPPSWKEVKDSNEDTKPKLSTGAMYLYGTGSKKYIDSAYVDAFGTVQANTSLRTVTRVFPSITVEFPTCRFWSSCYNGFTVGVNQGVTNAGAGFSLALGYSMGTRADWGNFSLFFGAILDPTVSQLAPYLKLGGFYPNPYLSTNLAQNGTAAALATNAAIQVPVRRVLGFYYAFGASWSISTGH